MSQKEYTVDDFAYYNVTVTLPELVDITTTLDKWLWIDENYNKMMKDFVGGAIALMGRLAKRDRVEIRIELNNRIELLAKEEQHQFRKDSYANVEIFVSPENVNYVVTLIMETSVATIGFGGVRGMYLLPKEDTQKAQQSPQDQLE